MTATTERGKFDGVVNIIRFNTRFYIASLVGLVIVACSWRFLPLGPLGKSLIAGAAFLMLFWTISSIAVSWYVYDHAAVTAWDWLQPLRRATRWANIHAGLDESTLALRRFFPGTDSVIIDIYDPVSMSEPSIEKARRLRPSQTDAISAHAGTLPLKTADRDTIFLLFAAHELRQSQQRTQLFQETSRALTPNGQILLVEHLRNAANFVAFGPGFFHFHSERSWRESIRLAGLRVVERRAVTPFVHCFTLEKETA